MQPKAAQLRARLLRRSELCSFLVIAACSSSSQRPVAPPLAPPARVERSVWSRFREAQSWPAVGEPFANAGHVGTGTRVVVRVSPEARPVYEHLVRDSVLPEGAVIAAFHLDAADRPTSVYVMRKSGGAWQFMTLRGDGTESVPPPTGQATHRCRDCHADGVGDSLFGVPRGDGSVP